MRKAFWIGAVFLWGAAAQAQVVAPADYVTSENSTGTVPFGSYQGLREDIDLYNLNLNVTVPLFSLPGRNGMTVAVSASYNAIQREWAPTDPEGIEPWELVRVTGCDADDPTGECPEVFTIQLLPLLTYVPGLVECPNSEQRFQNRYVFRQTDGTRSELTSLLADETCGAELGPAVTPAQKFSLETFRSSDSTHMELREIQDDHEADVYLKGGTLIHFLGIGSASPADWMRDTNGNRIDFSFTSGSLQTLTDTLGRTVERHRLNNGATILIRVLSADGTALDYTLTEVSASLQTLTLPSGLSYSFEYAEFGPLTQPPGPCPSGVMDKRLVKVTYPAGGYTRYEWQAAGERTILSAKYVSADGSALSEQQYLYVRHFSGGVHDYTEVRRPLGDFTRHWFGFFGPADTQREVRTEFFSASAAQLRKVERDWEDTLGDVRPMNETVTLNDISPALVRKTEFDYDSGGYVIGGTVTSNGNLTEMREYDWGQGAEGPLLRRTVNQYLSGSAYGVGSLHILNRLTRTQVFDRSGEQASQTDLFYDEYTALGSFSRNIIPVSPVQHDAGFDPFYLTRGNLSRRVDWLSTGEGDPVTAYRYDTAGNLRRLQDANSNPPSAVDYDSSTEFAYPSSISNALGHVESFQYDYSAAFDRGLGRLTSSTDANGRTTTRSYDILGRVKRIDFPDGGIERTYYSDLEPTATHHQTGSAVFPDQTQLPLRTKTYTLIESSPFLEREVFEVADGLARPSLRGLKNGFDMDWTGTEYDGNERVVRVSNPLSLFYGFGSDVPDPGFVAWTTTSYDGLDRPTEVETPDGNSITTVYSGNRTTATDQVGSARRSVTDALGRVVEVREPDPATGSLDAGSFTDTLYSYDPLDNLAGVLQGADANDQDGGGGGPSQSRSFLYDSLGRLVQESHPESGTSRYAYDANGNLLEKTDSRGRRIENDFDALNRIVSTSYSIDDDPFRTDPTPPVSYFYDGSTSLNRRGRLSSVTDGAGTGSFEYDPMGRISSSVRSTHGKTLTADYSYTFLGGVRTASYQGVSPSGYTLVYSYDSQGRQKTLGDGGGTPFITGYAFHYGLTDALEETDFANGTIEAVEYNNRLQPQQRIVYDPSFNELMDQYYFFDKPGGGGNNGNIWEIGNFLTFRSRHFDYDKLNRLTGASGSGWSIDYGYDRFGNRLSAVGSGSPPGFQGVSLSIAPSTNRITSPGWEYDGAGNVVEDGGAHHFVWDSAGRLVEMGPPQPSTSGPPGDDGRCTVPPCPPPPPPPPDPPPPLDDGRSSLRPGLKAQAAATMLYEYDYQDRRVVKDEGGIGRIYFWDEVVGEVVWEFPLEAPGAQDVVRGYFHGRLVVENDTRPGAGLHFMHRDHLGTSKLMTSFFSSTVVCDEIYHPFGQLQNEQPTGCNAHVRKFTGKERDAESGMDYFGARYYDDIMGRFMSPDPLLASADPGDPATWMRYSYTSNDPMSRVDPEGLRWFTKEGFEPIWVPDDEEAPEGWAPWAPTEEEPLLQGAVIGGEGYVLYGVDEEGNPTTQVVVVAGLQDDTPELIFLFAGGKIGADLAKGAANQISAAAAPVIPKIAEAISSAGNKVNTVTTYAYVRAQSALGPVGPLFGRHKLGIFNSNDYFRVGWSWSAPAGRQVFRIAIGSKRGLVHYHVTLF